MLAAQEKVAVCLSGGTDSALLTRAACDALAVKDILVLTAVTPFITAPELDTAAHLCKKLGGLHHQFVRVSLLTDPDIVKNDSLRCYYCKRKILRALLREANQAGFQALVCGGDLNDLGDYRPGERAAAELGVTSPLRQAGLARSEIYALLRQLGLGECVLPPNACLATRIATGEVITLKRLRLVCAAESVVRQFGFDMVRVRICGQNARIEVPAEQLPELQGQLSALCDELRALSFEQIDCAAYRRSGERIAHATTI